MNQQDSPAAVGDNTMEDFEWNEAQSIATAWSTTHNRTNRRTYGRRGNKKGVACGHRGNKKRALQQDDDETAQQYEMSTLSDQGALSDSVSSYERGSSSSSILNFDPTSSIESARALVAPAFPRPERIGSHHKRSKSLASFPMSLSSPALRRSNSVAASDFSFPASSTSSSSLTDWNENYDPNPTSKSNTSNGVFAPSALMRMSPQQPITFARNLQATTTPAHMDMQVVGGTGQSHKPRAKSMQDSPSFSSPASSTFSRLAKENADNASWVKASPTSRTAAAISNGLGLDFRDLNDESPSASVSTSGGSALGKRGVCGSPFGDEWSTTSSFKSRSRVFSMEPSALKTADAPMTMMQTERMSMHDDDDDSDKGADDEASASLNDDDSADEMETDHELGPPRGLRRHSSSNFDESVFGRTEHKSFSAEDVFDDMSSYDDLKFLIKALRKEKKGSSMTSFGISKVWTIAIPPMWPSDRRVSFLHWSTSILGFQLRPGGGSLTFLQIAKTKGGSVLQRLEAALVAHKRAEQERPRDIPTEVTTTRVNPPSQLPIAKSKSSRGKSVSSIRGARPQEDGKMEAELLRGVESLALNESQPMEEDRSMEETGNSFVRLVTMDPEVQVPPREPSFGPSPGRASFDSLPSVAPRLSDEHHVGGQDLVMHLHGLSPNPGRPPRLSNTSIYTAASSRPSGLLPSRGDMSPFVSAPLSASSRSDLQKNFSFADDTIETPLVKRSYDWRMSGRDWGASEQCPQPIIHELFGRLEVSFQASGLTCESPFAALEEPPGPPLMPTDFSSTAINSTELGFDFEMRKQDGSCIVEMEDEDMEEKEDKFEPAAPIPFVRRGSVGATALAELTLNENEHAGGDDRIRRRRMMSLAKHRRVSLCTTALPPVVSVPVGRKTIFSRPSVEPGLFAPRESVSLLGRQSVAPVLSPIAAGLSIFEEEEDEVSVIALQQPAVLSHIFGFLREHELLCSASSVCTTWADAATEAHASLMLVSVGCSTSTSNVSSSESSDDDSVDEESVSDVAVTASIARSMERNWKFITSRFPWACFLSEGSFKRVYKVWNSLTSAMEAVSVMDVDLIESTGNMAVVGAELAVSAMLSSLVRRNVCPNFVVTRGVFTCQYEPPASFWGTEDNKRPKGGTYNGQALGRKPREPSPDHRGRYQYMRMELCSQGDTEEFLKRQRDTVLPATESRTLLFQIAFSLHVAADRFSMKHYDIKLLNVFLQDVKNVSAHAPTESGTVLRYGLGSHIFALQMPAERSVFAKLADYGTANVQAESNGQPVTIGQFTTLENTPPEFLFLGDAATQGHAHDQFGLGLCMLHLFTGYAPYEEILDEVKCPPNLKKNLKRVWEGADSTGYDVIRSVILADVYEDEDGNIEGEPDEVLYDTLYRYLVLFGIPEDKYKAKECGRVWKAVTSALGGESSRKKTHGRNARSIRTDGPDSTRFKNDRKKYSLSHGSNKYISRARRSLQRIEGGMELLLSLVNFDPQKRGTALDVLNSTMMLPLREEPGQAPYNDDNVILSFMAYHASANN